jgi:dephospho-CoA kinase
VLRGDGGLDRERLGEIVFADPAMLRRLNGIVHPLVGRRMAELEKEAGQDAIVVHDVPLVAENDLGSAYDLVVVVDAPRHIQLDRLVGQRGMSREQAEARMAAQASREMRLTIADLVVDNSSSLAELDRQVGDLWVELRRRARLQPSR